MSIDWQRFEDSVRATAALKWGRPAAAEEINGVRCDCIVRLRPDYWIAIEISKENGLDKLRTDLAKFAALRPYLFSQGIYVECYFVCLIEGHPSLRETGRGMAVDVHSFESFHKLFIDYESYKVARSARPFGSAVDPATGEIDKKSYIQVRYISNNGYLSLQDMVDLLRRKSKIILLGNFGTGKSRCLQEIFRGISELYMGLGVYPIAINLKENWGLQRGEEIVRRHFQDLGLSDHCDSAIKLLRTDALCLLLDGFDEVGSQTWSDDPQRLGKIREESLSGVKDLISQAKGGVLIAGREHYFNSMDEMFKCLGLSPANTVLVECSDQFTEEEMAVYLGETHPGLILPPWLPRRPLVCQILSDLPEDLRHNLSNSAMSQFEFWSVFVESVCSREARINPRLDGTAIRGVLRILARETRGKSANVGPISISEINEAFLRQTGLPPNDESAAILQRLPGIGRIGAESTDRQFVDEYILDGLRAEDVIDLVESCAADIFHLRWKNPLGVFGLSILASHVLASPQHGLFQKAMLQASRAENKICAGDILAALLMDDSEVCNFGEVNIEDSHMVLIDLSGKKVKSINIKSSFIGELNIAGAVIEDCKFEDCVIRIVRGVSSAEGLPACVASSSVEMFDAINTVVRIKQAQLSDSQRIFITIVKKIFFQPGGGRKEAALLRGLGAAGDSRIANRIIKLLVGEKLIDRHSGDEGLIYTPNRKHTRRMHLIMAQLTLSEDPLWVTISNY